jgi:preflagellin peptidase FlaK
VLLLLDLARLLLGTALLAFASFTDWRWRRAPNALWWVMAGAASLFLLVEAARDPAPLAGRWPYLLGVPVLVVLASETTLGDVAAGALALAGAAGAFVEARVAPDGLTAQWPYLVGIVAFAALIYAFWYFGLIAGGADAKALMAIAVLLPFPLALGDSLPLLRDPLPGSFGVLADSLVLFLVVPLALFTWNVAHGDVRLPYALLGLKRKARDVTRGHAWPMELVDTEGKRSMRLFSSRMSPSEADEAFGRVQALGDERVWVTPKIPYMLPLLGGFVCAFVLGDLLLAAMGRLGGH